MVRGILRRVNGAAKRLEVLARGGRVALSTGLLIDPGAVTNFGRRIFVHRYGSIFVEDGGALELKDAGAIMQGCEIVVMRGASLSIGAHVYLGAYCNIRCGRRITIGDNVRCAQWADLSCRELCDGWRTKCLVTPHPAFAVLRVIFFGYAKLRN